MLLVRCLALIGGDVVARLVVAGAIRQQLALLVDDRDALGAQTGDCGGDEVADGADL